MLIYYFSQGVLELTTQKEMVLIKAHAQLLPTFAIAAVLVVFATIPFCDSILEVFTVDAKQQRRFAIKPFIPRSVKLAWRTPYPMPFLVDLLQGVLWHLV